MIADVESGMVGTIIIKDMSRLGRDYLKVGYYTEIMFPEAGVRFIAINKLHRQCQSTGQRFYTVPQHHQRMVRQGHQQENPSCVQIQG